MRFNLYTFVGLKEEKKENLTPNLDQKTYFIREILADDTYICDVYDEEKHVSNHLKIKLSSEDYEKKDIKATYKIREYYPDTGTFVDNPTVFTSIESIRTDAPRYAIWGVSIVCDTDCKTLGIDPAAPWPPKAA